MTDQTPPTAAPVTILELAKELRRAVYTSLDYHMFESKKQQAAFGRLCAAVARFNAGEQAALAAAPPPEGEKRDGGAIVTIRYGSKSLANMTWETSGAPAPFNTSIAIPFHKDGLESNEIEVTTFDGSQVKFSLSDRDMISLGGSVPPPPPAPDGLAELTKRFIDYRAEVLQEITEVRNDVSSLTTGVRSQWGDIMKTRERLDAHDAALKKVRDAQANAQPILDRLAWMRARGVLAPTPPDPAPDLATATLQGSPDEVYSLDARSLPHDDEPDLSISGTIDEAIEQDRQDALDAHNATLDGLEERINALWRHIQHIESVRGKKYMKVANRVTSLENPPRESIFPDGLVEWVTELDKRIHQYHSHQVQYNRKIAQRVTKAESLLAKHQQRMDTFYDYHLEQRKRIDAHDAALKEVRDQIGWIQDALDTQADHISDLHAAPTLPDPAPDDVTGRPDVTSDDAMMANLRQRDSNRDLDARRARDVERLVIAEADAEDDKLATEIRHCLDHIQGKDLYEFGGWVADHLRESGLIPAPALVEHAIYAAIVDERAAQAAKWGRQRHSWPEWLSILAEELGEASQAANQAHWAKNDCVRNARTDALREELVQVAAVAVQIIEHLDEVAAGQGGTDHE